MPDSPKKTRVLILGAGFGGTYAAMRLEKTLAKRSDCEITLVDRNNFILFTPMLHEVAASDLDPTDIVNPIRKLLKRVAFCEAEVESVDLDAKTVEISYGLPRKRRTLQYDHLVIGLGSGTRFFDEQTAKFAVELKTIGDAFFLRNRMIAALEAAEVEQDPEERKRMMTFVVAGGGFTGVEAAGAMNDFLHNALRFYPRLEPTLIRLVLAHHGDVLLPEFSPNLGRYTEAKLREGGIDVRLRTGVTTYDGRTVQLDHGEPIEAGTLLWSAGVAPGKIVQALALKKEKGRIVVDACMRSVDRPEIWVLGDAAAVPNSHNGEKPFAATAQTAIRQGPALARNIEAVVLGTGQPKPFRFKTLGQLAAIGHRRGTAQVFGVMFSGFPAWFMWRSVYLSKLPRLEKKIRVGIAWAMDLCFTRDIVQVVTLADIRRITEFGMRNELGPAPVAAETQPPR